MKGKKLAIYLNDKSRIEMLSTEEKGQLLQALLNYMADEDMPDMNQGAAITFSFMKPQLDKDFKLSNSRALACRGISSKRAQ